MLTDHLLQGALNRILAFWSFTYQTLKTENVDSFARIIVLYVGFPRLVLAAESGEWGDTSQM